MHFICIGSLIKKRDFKKKHIRFIRICCYSWVNRMIYLMRNENFEYRIYDLFRRLGNKIYSHD